MQIRRLPDEVVQRIAAGEVVVRPSNAIKELVENSLDAASDAISIIAVNGGITKVVVEDTGSGIRAREDFEVLCERFTTSKLREFEDLAGIETLGFRGEALCSISHVAHLSVQSGARLAKYHQSKLLSLEEEATPPLLGTRVVYEDLFFNQTVRRRSLNNTDEYKRITALVQRFALHFPHVAFSLKKTEFSPNCDLLTPGRLDTLQAVQLLFGLAPHDLVSVDFTEDDMRISGVISRPSCTAAFFSLAINERLVEAGSVRKLVEEIFAKDARNKCFAVLNLQVARTTVDVNVHPTKKDVLFQNKAVVMDFVKNAIRNALLDSASTRRVTAASLVLQPLPALVDGPAQAGARADIPALAPAPAPAPAPTPGPTPSVRRVVAPVPQPQKIRTDATQATLVSRPKNLGTRFVWVGAVDERHAAVQFGEDLLLVDVKKEALKHPQIFTYRISYLEEELDLHALIMRGLEDKSVTDPDLAKDERWKIQACRQIAAKLRNHPDLRIQNQDERETLAGFAFFDEAIDHAVTRLPELVIRIALDEEDAAFAWFVENSFVEQLWNSLAKEDVQLEHTRVVASLSKLYREFERC